MSDIVKTYNPANSAALTAAQLNELQNLTTDQIKQLAKAYPNGSFNRAYLLIEDSSSTKRQMPTLSTFENLYNLRTKNGLQKYVAVGFRGNYKPVNVFQNSKRKTEVLDLSDTELLTLPGFKTGVGTNKEESFPEETVEVTKVEKQLAEEPKRTRRTKAQIEADKKKTK
jgi:hypothetical protein